MQTACPAGMRIFWQSSWGCLTFLVRHRPGFAVCQLGKRPGLLRFQAPGKRLPRVKGAWFSSAVWGTVLNAAGILIGGILGLTLAKQMKPSTQQTLKLLLGLLTIFVGLQTTWTSLGGGFWSVGKQLTIVILAMILGKLTGRLLRLQKGVNYLGRYARERFEKSQTERPNRFGEGFITATLLFCVGPMAILGAVQDGLEGRWQTLGIKALLDGLATMAFVTTFGWGVILAVIPVVAYQGTLTLSARLLEPYLRDNAMLDSVSATGGILVFSIALVILEIRRVELADYLPSLAYAPFLTWLWR